MLAFGTIRSLTNNLQQSSMGIACGCSNWLLSSTGKGAVCDVTGSNTCKEYQYTRHGSLIFGVYTRQKSRWERSPLPQIHKPLISHSLTSLCANLCFKQVRFKFLFHSILCGWRRSSFHFLQKQYVYVGWHTVHESVWFDVHLSESEATSSLPCWICCRTLLTIATASLPSPFMSLLNECMYQWVDRVYS